MNYKIYSTLLNYAIHGDIYYVYKKNVGNNETDELSILKVIILYIVKLKNNLDHASGHLYNDDVINVRF